MSLELKAGMTASSETQHHIQVEAPRAQLVGTTSVVDGWPVVYVGERAKAAIQHRTFVANYTRRSDRPWRIGSRSFGSLANALRALAVEA